MRIRICIEHESCAVSYDKDMYGQCPVCAMERKLEATKTLIADYAIAMEMDTK